MQAISATTMTEEAPVIPQALLASPLFTESRGFRVYSGLPDPCTFNGLLSEAIDSYPSATAQESLEPDYSEYRGGKPPRKLLTSTAGPIQDAWYSSEWLQGFLSSQLGMPVVPAGNRGSYSYYARPGDFLDLHCDVETCDLALITALHDNSAPTDQNGGLVVYPERTGEPLSAVRARPQDGGYLVKLLPGQTIALLGGIVPHRVVPVSEGQLRIISVMCFRAVV
jgi:hypothetical protein